MAILRKTVSPDDTVYYLVMWEATLKVSWQPEDSLRECGVGHLLDTFDAR